MFTHPRRHTFASGALSAACNHFGETAMLTSTEHERAAKQTCRRHRLQEFLRSDTHATRQTDTILNCASAAHKTEKEQRLGTHAHAATKTETECHLAAIGPSLEKVARAPTPASSGDTNHHVKSSPYKHAKKRTGREDHVRPFAYRRRS